MMTADVVPQGASDDPAGATVASTASGEAELAARSRAFEQEALRWLPDVARFAMSLTHSQPDADDLVQETYLKAFRSWRTFHEGADARRWLFTICKRSFLQVREREQRTVEVEGEPELETLAAVRMHAAAVRSGAGDLWAQLDLGPAIERAMAGLPEYYRAVAVVVDVEGYGYEDAAALLELPLGTVRSRLFRARRLLQESLFEYARDAGFAIPRATDPSSRPARAEQEPR